MLPSNSHSQLAAIDPIIAAYVSDVVFFNVNEEYASSASPAPTGSFTSLVNDPNEVYFLSLLERQNTPRFPSLRIKFLKFADFLNCFS